MSFIILVPTYGELRGHYIYLEAVKREKLNKVSSAFDENHCDEKNVVTFALKSFE